MRTRRALTALIAGGVALTASAGLVGAQGGEDQTEALLASLGLDEEQIEELSDEVDDLLLELIEVGVVDGRRAAALRDAIASGAVEEYVQSSLDDAQERWEEVRGERLEAWDYVRDGYSDCVDGGGERDDCRRDARDEMEEIRDEWRDERFDLLRSRAENLPEDAQERILEAIDEREDRAEEREDDRDERQEEREERRDEREDEIEERREDREERRDDRGDDSSDDSGDDDSSDDSGDEDE
ncbi:MAG: hypothetical protein AAGD18_18060 [Actinomycetota bacterium]